MNNYSMFNMMGMGYPYMGTDCYGKQPSFGETLAQGLVYSLVDTGMGAFGSIFTGLFSGLGGCVSGAIAGSGGSGSSAGAARSQTPANHRAIDSIDDAINAALAEFGNAEITELNYMSANIGDEFDKNVKNALTNLNNIRSKIPTLNEDGTLATANNYDQSTYNDAMTKYNEALANAQKLYDDAVAKKQQEEQRIADLKVKVGNLLEEKNAAIKANQEMISDIRIRGTIDDSKMFQDNKVHKDLAKDITIEQASQLIDFYIKHNKINSSSSDDLKAESIRNFFKENLGKFDNRIMNRYGEAIRLIANDNADRYGIL